MNSNFKDRFIRFSVLILIYSVIIFLFFKFAFSKYELKDNIVNDIEKSQTLVKNLNGIDVNSLSKKVNTGSKPDVLTEEIVRNGLKNTTDKDIIEILKNQDKLSFGYLALLYRNPSAKLFVKDKLENRIVDNFRGESVDFKRNIPYYLQWDRRWGQKKYTNENIAMNGCGPTCMAMVVSGLLKDDNITPVEMAKYEEYSEGAGTSWKYFKEVSKKYGILSKELKKDEKVYKDELKNGRPIILNVGVGDFSMTGHYIVLTGFDEEGNFIINDPNSPQKSNETWSFERLKPQIKNSWSFYKGE